MIRVRYAVEFAHDDRATELPGDTRAVPAHRYEWCDVGQGGITFEEVDPGDVQALAVFPAGSELFIDSGNPADVLDSTDETTERGTRIWWRVIVVEEGTS
jgi:hypothetical protein